MSWEEACATMLSLKVGSKLRRPAPYGEVHRWEVRGVLPDDHVAVVRRWLPHRRGYSYDIMRPEALMVGLFTVVPSRPGRKRPKTATSGQDLPDRESPLFCEHANEVPQACPCAPDCYCKDHTCCYREAS